MDIIAPISNFMVTILHAVNSVTHNYGLTLIVFAGLVKLALYGPTQQMYVAQKKMEKVKPRMDAIRERYKDDPTKMNEEMMKLYKETGLNPLGGCLPLLIQMPILIAIWRAIMSQPEVFGNAHFMWIRPGALQSVVPGYFATSLADPDIAMLLFYGIMMLLSQALTPGTGDASQKQMGLMMSVFFTWMVWKYKWPCALVLYWSTFQFLSILQQMLILRKDPEPTP